MRETGELEYPIAISDALQVDSDDQERISASDYSDYSDSSAVNAPAALKDVIVVGGVWIKETGTCAPVLGIRIHEKLLFGFKAKQRAGKAPDYHIFEYSSDGVMAEVGCLWLTHTLPGGRCKEGEKLLIRLGDEYLFAVRPAPVKVKKADGSETVKAPTRKEPTFLVLAVAPTTALAPFPKGQKGAAAPP